MLGFDRSIGSRERGGKEIDFEAGSAVIPWPSADPLTRVHASTFETKEGRKEAKASLICCMSAGSDAFIMRPPASKRAPVPPLSLSLSRLHRGGEKRPAVSPGRSRVCLRAACTQRAARKTRVRFHVSTRMDNGGRHGETHAGLPSYASTTSVRNTAHRSVHDHASIRLGLRSFAIPGSRGPFTGERMKFDGVSETIRGGEGGGGGGVPLSPVVRSFRFFERKYR